LDLGLQVFCPILEGNYVFDELMSPLPPLPCIATNFPYNFIELLSIEKLSFQLSNFEPLSIKTTPIEEIPIDLIIFRTYHFINPFPVGKESDQS
jgi:hypothetical protein